MSRRGKILITVFCAILAVMLVAVARHYQLRVTTDSYIAQLKAEGEPMDLAQVVPPAVPPEQNSADTLRQAFALIRSDQGLLRTNYGGMGLMRGIAPGKAMVCWQQSEDKEEDDDRTNSWQELSAAVAQNQKVFALLQQIITKPDADFGIHYSRGSIDLDFTNLYMMDSPRAAEWLCVAMACDLHQGDTASAVINLRAMLALAKALRNERLVITEWSRSGVAQLAVPANWELLQSPNLTDEELTQLQQDWTDLDFKKGAEEALEMDRVTGEIALQQWRESNGKLEHFFDEEDKARAQLGPADSEADLGDKIIREPKVFLWRHWWSYPDERRALTGYGVLIHAVRMVETNAPFLNAIDYQTEKFGEMGLTNEDNDFHYLISHDVTFLQGYVQSLVRVEVVRQVVVTAIALKRYQLKHGKYPAVLDSLVPEFLPAVLPNPVDGKPLRYRLNANGTFLLHSGGRNGKDDEGTPLYGTDPKALDWVWPQPATAAEIEYYYSHPQK